MFLNPTPLKAETEKAQADKSHATPFGRSMAFAASKGFTFTADDAKARAKGDGKELTDAELDGVAGILRTSGWHLAQRRWNMRDRDAKVPW